MLQIAPTIHRSGTRNPKKNKTLRPFLQVKTPAESKQISQRSPSNPPHRYQVLKAKGMKVQAPSPALKSGFQKVGEQLTQDWLKKAGAEGQGIVDAYKKM